MIKACLIGKKLGHSISPVIHERFYETSGINGTYELCETPEDGLKDLLNRLKQEGYRGANVTIPYKTIVIQYLDGISDKAKAIGAVNTIHFSEGKAYGYNTDYFGLKTLIQSNNIEIEAKKVIVLGTGGAAKCAKKLVQDMGAEEVVSVSRTQNQGAITYKRLEESSSIDVLINTTPVGMFPDVYGCPVTDEVIKKCESVVDVVYNPMKTQLIRKAMGLSNKIATGLMMLTAQAVKAQEIWNSQSFSIQVYSDVYKYVEKLKTNIVLIGMPGSGKSSIGKIVADKLGKSFVDTDSLIEQKHGRIPDIFANEGEKVFRVYEGDAAELAADIRGAVIATGGGIILNEKNMDVLKQSGIVFFIDRPLDVLLKTTDGSYRPLIADDNNRIKVLYKQRYPLYCKYADYTVNNSAETKSCVNDIINLWGSVQ